MGNCPPVYLHCELCDVSMALPNRQPPMFYWDETSQVCAAIPSCLGFCDCCQRLISVEDFSTPIAALRQQLWALEQQQHEMVGQIWPRLKLRFWPASQRQYAELSQQIAATELLLRVRQIPERQPRCLSCGSTAFIGYPEYPYRDSCFLAKVPETLRHSCGELWQVRYSDFSWHIRTTPYYFSLFGDKLL